MAKVNETTVQDHIMQASKYRGTSLALSIPATVILSHYVEAPEAVILSMAAMFDYILNMFLVYINKR